MLLHCKSKAGGGKPHDGLNVPRWHNPFNSIRFIGNKLLSSHVIYERDVYLVS